MNWWDWDYADQASSSKADEIRGDDKFDPEYEQFCVEPFLHHLRSRYYPYSIPPCFKRDHPDDDLFMDNVGKSQVQHPLEDDKEVIESLTKQVVVELIWKDTRTMKKYIWNNKKFEHLYTSIIESAVSLVYFLYPQAELYRIGRSRALNEELDELWDQLQEDRPFNAVCTLVNQLTSTQNQYNLVTEEFIADMIYAYPDFTHPRVKNPCFPSFPVVAEKDKDKLYKDIAEVVKHFEPPPLEPDEYTHWMMTFLRGDTFDVELNIMRKFIINGTEGGFDEPLLTLLHELLIKAKLRLKEKLLNVVQPLIKICQPVHHKNFGEIIEIVEVAELRRIAVGDQFIGRSHLLWAFYKLGYSLPLKFRNLISVNVQDEGHPPYHIYMAAAMLSFVPGDKWVYLVGFIYAVIHSQDVNFDGWLSTSTFGGFESFKKDLEKMEKEIEPKHTVTTRPCRAVDAIIQEMRERYDD